MRALFLASLFPLLALAGCGSSTAPITGTIDFGASQYQHVLHHRTTQFGARDTFAYIAHVAPRSPIPPHTKITESYFTVDRAGKEHVVMSDSFRLTVPITKYVVLNSIPVSDLYVVGLLAPGTYHVRLVHAGEKLAEGTFHLR